MRGAPPPIIFERLKLPQQIIYRQKGNLSESPNHFKYRKNMLISRFYEQFSRKSRNLGHFGSSKKISNSYNINISCIILKRVIWRFQIYNLFCEIFKFREDKSNNELHEILKCFRKAAKFELCSLFGSVLPFKNFRQQSLILQKCVDTSNHLRQLLHKNVRRIESLQI